MSACADGGDVDLLEKATATVRVHDQEPDAAWTSPKRTFLVRIEPLEFR